MKIKFRAWHKVSKRMLKVSQLSWETHPDGIERMHFHALLDEKETGQGEIISGFGATDGSEDTGWVLLQYTGFKDKQGNEIYGGENDIPK